MLIQRFDVGTALHSGKPNVLGRSSESDDLDVRPDLEMAVLVFSRGEEEGAVSSEGSVGIEDITSVIGGGVFVDRPVF